MQHPSHRQSAIDRGVLVISQDGFSTKSVTPLPTAYTAVPPATLQTKEFSVPPVEGPVRPSTLLVSTAATEDEYA